MRMMYCYIEPWIIEQKVYTVEDDTSTPLGEVKLEELPIFLATAYSEKEYEKIVLHGSIKGIVEESVERTKTFALTNFGLNDINIEIIE